MAPKNNRNSALDLLRCFALLMVVLVHFFLNTGYYDQTVEGWGMYALTLVRSGATICVPLFLMLSGYLMHDRNPTRAYYCKLIKTLVLYVLASLACGAVNWGYNYIMGRETLSLWEMILGIFAFNTAPYGWYVEMYLCLFLLIPFLNVLYNNLSGKQEKALLLLILLGMTALPPVVNSFRLVDISWWLKPSSNQEYTPLIPDWWNRLYPLTYYYLGCWLREYPLQLKKRTALLGASLAILLTGTYCYYRSMGTCFLWGPWQEQSSLLVLVPAVLLFDCLAKLDLSRWSPGSRKWLARCSDWCFGAYLLSWIFDKAVYMVVNRIFPAFPARVPWIFVTVPVVFLCSLAASAVMNLCYQAAAGILRKKQ